MGVGVKIIELIINQLQKRIKNVLRLLKLAVYLYRYQLNINKNDMNTATQTLNQLGGNKFIAMTGATCFSDNETLIVKFKGSRVANIMYVTLNSMDTYDVKICKFRGTDVKTIKEVSGAYSDMLRNIFESTTGLRTSL